MALSRDSPFDSEGDSLIATIKEDGPSITANWPVVLNYPRLLGARASITSRDVNDRDITYQAVVKELTTDISDEPTMILTNITINSRKIAEDGLAIPHKLIRELKVIFPGPETRPLPKPRSKSRSKTPSKTKLPPTPLKVKNTDFHVYFLSPNELDLFYLQAIHRAVSPHTKFSDWCDSSEITSYMAKNNLSFGRPLGKGDELPISPRGQEAIVDPRGSGDTLKLLPKLSAGVFHQAATPVSNES